MRKIVRPILVLLAIVFLIEAWLWEKLEPIVARVVRLIPLESLKQAIAEWVDTLPPYGTLVLFVVPLLLVLPIKLVELWLFVNGNWLEGLGTLIVAKLVVLGVTAFLFDVTRDKLMQLDWFRVLYDYMVWARQWAHDVVEPIKLRIKFRMRLLAPGRTRRAWRLLRRIRRRMRVPPTPPELRTAQPK